MAEVEDLRGFFTKEEVEALLKKELERQIMIYLEKGFKEEDSVHITRDSENVTDISSVKKLNDSPQNFTDNNEIPETAVLLESFDALNPTSEANTTVNVAANRLDRVADSLLDVRVEHLKKKTNNARQLRNNGRYDLHDMHRNRSELYFCYIVYFALVFWSFVLAVYVWTPIVRGIIYGRK